MCRDGPAHQGQHLVSLDTAADAFHQDRMPDAREVGSDVHLGVPGKPAHVLMNSRRRRQRPLADAAGVRVVDRAPDPGPDSTGSSKRDEALVRGNRERRSRAALGHGSRIDGPDQLAPSDSGFPPAVRRSELPDRRGTREPRVDGASPRGKEGRFRKIVALGDVVEINPYPFHWGLPWSGRPSTALTNYPSIPRQRPRRTS